MSEEKKVRLRVVSRMTDPDGDVMETKNARRGALREADGALVLEYEDEQDGERARILLEMKPGRMPGENRVRMQRKGMMSGKLTFLPGQRAPGSYVTLYGEIPVAVDTRRVIVEQEKDGGRLLLDYDVYMGGARTSSAVMEIIWRI